MLTKRKFVLTALILASLPICSVFAENSSADWRAGFATYMRRVSATAREAESSRYTELHSLLFDLTREHFFYADNNAWKQISSMSFDCAEYGGDSRPVDLETSLRLSLLEVVWESGNPEIRYISRTLANGEVVVDSVSPPRSPGDQPLSIRALTMREGRVLNTVLSASGQRNTCDGQFGPVWNPG